MMNIIPITPATLDLIQKLNDGVRPNLEDDSNAYYVYRGESEPASIISQEELDSDEYPEYMAVISITYIGD